VPIVRQNLHIRNRQSFGKGKEKKRKKKQNEKKKDSTPYLNLVDLLRQA
jgi:hypothetical protein